MTYHYIIILHDYVDDGKDIFVFHALMSNLKVGLGCRRPANVAINGSWHWSYYLKCLRLSSMELCSGSEGYILVKGVTGYLIGATQTELFMSPSDLKRLLEILSQ